MEQYKTVDDFLQHHGILGMRWGVRRPIGPDGLIRRSGSEDFQISRSLKKKGAKQLSDAELQKVTKRLQLEQSLHELNTKSVKRGQDWVKVGTGLAATAISVYTLSQTKAGQALISKVKNAMSTAGNAKWLV